MRSQAEKYPRVQIESDGLGRHRMAQGPMTTTPGGRTRRRPRRRVWLSFHIPRKDVEWDTCPVTGTVPSAPAPVARSPAATAGRGARVGSAKCTAPAPAATRTPRRRGKAPVWHVPGVPSVAAASPSERSCGMWIRARTATAGPIRTLDGTWPPHALARLDALLDAPRTDAWAVRARVLLAAMRRKYGSRRSIGQKSLGPYPDHRWPGRSSAKPSST